MTIHHRGGECDDRVCTHHISRLLPGNSCLLSCQPLGVLPLLALLYHSTTSRGSIHMVMFNNSLIPRPETAWMRLVQQLPLQRMYHQYAGPWTLLGHMQCVCVRWCQPLCPPRFYHCFYCKRQSVSTACTVRDQACKRRSVYHCSCCKRSVCHCLLCKRRSV